MLVDKTFLLGVGAQKAGTTWLHHYLSNRADVWLPQIKELHYLDVRFRPEFSTGFIGKALRRLQEHVAASQGELEFSERLRNLMDHVRLYYEENGYFEFFASRVGAQPLFGEITPAYSIVPKEAFAYVKSIFPRSKAILLMRDPIERHHSQLRMREMQKTQFNANANFIRALKNPQIYERSLYHLTYQRLLTAFDRKEIFVGFYESFFSDAEIGRLCEFLDIPFLAGNYTELRNPSAPRRPIPSKDWHAAREAFSEVYEFCREEFGDRVPSNWGVQPNE